MLKYLHSYIAYQIICATCFELLQFEKYLQKEGLHRDLITNISIKIENLFEYEECSLIIKENVTKDTYIYMEEAKAIKGFHFWPHIPNDIEKPSSVSKD